jgi:effector-binding domain-containing protein
MLTLPTITTRAAQHYVSLHDEVMIPFGDKPGAAFDKLEAYLTSKGQTEFGPSFFRYNVIDMPRLELEFGFLTPRKVDGSGDIVSSVVPAGRYVELMYTGPYDNLMDVNAIMIGWARQKGLVWDSTETPKGEAFAGRFEFYLDPPIGDPKTWRTQLAFRLRD